MTLLILGLALFLGVHSIGILAPAWRDRTAARLGQGPWMGLYSLASLLGLVLIVWGYGQARLDPTALYAPPLWTRHLALLLMVPVFPLLLATYLPGRIQAAVGHPMLAAVKLWAFAHLLANGNLADVTPVRGLPRLGRGRPHLAQGPNRTRGPRCRRGQGQRLDRPGRRPGALRRLPGRCPPVADRRIAPGAALTSYIQGGTTAVGMC